MLSAVSDLGDRGLGLGRPSVRRGRGHYDPDQPRVQRGHPDGGQWTDEDGVPARSSPVPSPVAIPAPVAPPRVPLGVAAGAAGIAAAAFAAAMTTFSRSVGRVEEGELRHFPGLRYRYDDGFLTIHGHSRMALRRCCSMAGPTRMRCSVCATERSSGASGQPRSRSTMSALRWPSSGTRSESVLGGRRGSATTTRSFALRKRRNGRRTTISAGAFISIR
jgi:hypothetical protein